MARTRYSRETFEFVDLDKALLTELATNPKAFSALHAKVALDELKLEQDRGNLKDPVYLTDNRVTRNLIQVRVGGKIEFRDKASPSEFLEYAIKYLRRRSPLDKRPTADGYVYRESFAVLVNGKVTRSATRAAIVKPDDIITIVNYQPYAKKIEFADSKTKPNRKKNRYTGKTVALGQSIKAPNGVMRSALKHFRDRYGSEFFIQFNLTRGSDATTGATGAGSPVKPFTGSQGRLLYPSISFTSKNAAGSIT